MLTTIMPYVLFRSGFIVSWSTSLYLSQQDKLLCAWCISIGRVTLVVITEASIMGLIYLNVVYLILSIICGIDSSEQTNSVHASSLHKYDLFIIENLIASPAFVNFM